MPGSFQVLSPTDTASDATTKNQPPDIDIIVFHTRPGTAKGTSSFQKRCQALRWKLSDASVKSAGTVFSDWYTLHAMFHAWRVKSVKIPANSRPRTYPANRPMNKTTVKVRNPRIGTDCSTSRMGNSTRAARRLFAAAVP